MVLDKSKEPPLLGASFLNNFVTKFDPKLGKLTLTSVQKVAPSTPVAVGGMIK